MSDLPLAAVMPNGGWQFHTTDGRPYTMNIFRRDNRYTRIGKLREWREKGRVCGAGCAMPFNTPVGIIVTPLHLHRGSPQDTGACAPAVKAFVDGLVDVGVLPDDSPKVVRELVFHAPDVCGVDGLRVEVVPLP